MASTSIHTSTYVCEDYVRHNEGTSRAATAANPVLKIGTIWRCSDCILKALNTNSEDETSCSNCGDLTPRMYCSACAECEDCSQLAQKCGEHAGSTICDSAWCDRPAEYCGDHATNACGGCGDEAHYCSAQCAVDGGSEHPYCAACGDSYAYYCTAQCAVEDGAPYPGCTECGDAVTASCTNTTCRGHTPTAAPTLVAAASNVANKSTEVDDDGNVSVGDTEFRFS